MITDINPSDLLIAPPNIPDPRFRKSVIMLTHRHEGGNFALCINRPSRYVCNDIIKELDLGPDIDLRIPLYWGGPINSSTVWMLHTSEWTLGDPTVEINSDWAMTSNEAMFAHLADGDHPRQFRLLFGFCSWAPGQLEAELRGLPPWNRRHSWLVAHNPGAEWLFEQPVENLWESTTTLCSHQAVDSWL